MTLMATAKPSLMCKTAPGTIDGQGKPVVMGDDDPQADYRNAEGIILKGGIPHRV